MSESHFEIHWIDRGRPATQPANSDYPNGIPIDLSNGAQRTCTLDLPCPAPRGREDRQCGLWSVHCRRCGQVNVLTTAGRADDPRSVKMACQLQTS
jgi:hypothetical protein